MRFDDILNCAIFVHYPFLLSNFLCLMTTCVIMPCRSEHRVHRSCEAITSRTRTLVVGQRRHVQRTTRYTLRNLRDFAIHPHPIRHLNSSSSNLPNSPLQPSSENTTQPIVTSPQATQHSRPTMPQQRLAPKRRIVLQQVIDIAHPVIFCARPSTFFALRVHRLCRNRRAVDAWDRVRRRTHSDALPWSEYPRLLSVHRDACGCAGALSNLDRRTNGNCVKW